MTRKVYADLHRRGRGAMLRYGIYALILCEMYHILLAWCALSRPLCRSDVEDVAQKCRLKLQGYAKERLAGWGLGIYTPSIF